VGLCRAINKQALRLKTHSITLTLQQGSPRGSICEELHACNPCIRRNVLCRVSVFGCWAGDRLRDRETPRGGAASTDTAGSKAEDPPVIKMGYGEGCRKVKSEATDMTEVRRKGMYGKNERVAHGGLSADRASASLPTSGRQHRQGGSAPRLSVCWSVAWEW
jgi:hypothetical protein